MPVQGENISTLTPPPIKQQNEATTLSGKKCEVICTTVLFLVFLPDSGAVSVASSCWMMSVS